MKSSQNSDEGDDFGPEIDIEYDPERIFVHALSSNYYSMKDKRQELRDENRVVKWDETDWYRRTGMRWNKSIIGNTGAGNPVFGKTDSLQIHLVELAPEGESQNHVHQNEALMYILNGKGYEIHDGKRYEWEPGDLALIHGGCAHKHYSVDPEIPARALIIKAKPLYLFLHLLNQQYISKGPQHPIPGWEDYEPDEFGTPTRINLDPAHEKVLEKIVDLAPDDPEDHPHSHHHEYMHRHGDGHGDDD